MKKIRFGVFETNSSSSHTITIDGEDMIPEFKRDVLFPLEDDVVEIHLGDCEFGWGWGYEYYKDSWNKLKYLVMMVVETEYRFTYEPHRVCDRNDKNQGVWKSRTYKDKCYQLESGTIEKWTGHKLSWQDVPLKISQAELDLRGTETGPQDLVKILREEIEEQNVTHIYKPLLNIILKAYFEDILNLILKKKTGVITPMLLKEHSI